MPHPPMPGLHHGPGDDPDGPDAPWAAGMAAAPDWLDAMDAIETGAAPGAVDALDSLDSPGLHDLHDPTAPARDGTARTASVQAWRQAVLPGAVTDAQLAAWLSAVADHDERALGALYDATAARVHGLVLRIVRRPPLSEEVVEDTYFQVWRQAARFDPQRGGPMSWLLGMARSRAIDAIRREARFQHEPLQTGEAAPAHETGATAQGSDELLDAARHHAELHRALLQLSAQPRQLVALAFFRGLSHEEIAQQTALPLGTVKSQIRRALITLAQVLGEIGAGAAVSTPATPCPS